MTLKRRSLCLLILLMTSILLQVSASATSPEQFSVPNSDFLALKATLIDTEQASRTPMQSFQLAVVLWRLGDQKAAIAITDQLKAASYAPPSTLYLKGLIHLSQVEDVSIFKKLGVAKKAIGAWEQAVDADPSHLLANFAVIAFYINAPSFAGGDLETARALLPKLQQLDNSYYQLANGLLLAKEDDVVGAERMMLAATKTIRDPAVAWFQLAQLYFRDQQFKKADDALANIEGQGLWHHPTPGLVLMMQGLARAELSETEGARDAFRAALEKAQNPKITKRVKKALKALDT